MRSAGAHVAIVSDKPQTTRQRALGVVHGDDWQIVLVDLPGFQKPFDALTRRMQRSVDDNLRDVDAVLLVLDASEFSGGGDRYIAEQLVGHRHARRDRAQQGRPAQAAGIAEAITAVSGLIDYVALHPDQRAHGRRRARARGGAREAAARGAGVLRAGRRLGSAARAAHRRAGARAGAARTREEVPHAIAVVVDEIKAPRGKHAGRVVATLIVEATSQQGILVGKDGATVRAIGTAARPEIERLMGGSIYLDLRVKVRRGWRRDDALLERFGL